MGGWVMLVYWLHKAGEAAGDRMRLDRRIPLLVSTFKYTLPAPRIEGKCFTFSFLNLRLRLSQPSVWVDQDQGISGLGGFSHIRGGLASETNLSVLQTWHWSRQIDPEHSHHLEGCCWKVLKRTKYQLSDGQFCILAQQEEITTIFHLNEIPLY